MKNLNNALMIEQLDKKLSKFALIDSDITPGARWIKSIRTALNISLVQFAKMLNKLRYNPLLG